MFTRVLDVKKQANLIYNLPLVSRKMKWDAECNKRSNERMVVALLSYVLEASQLTNIILKSAAYIARFLTDFLADQKIGFEMKAHGSKDLGSSG